LNENSNFSRHPSACLLAFLKSDTMVVCAAEGRIDSPEASHMAAEALPVSAWIAGKPSLGLYMFREHMPV